MYNRVVNLAFSQGWKIIHGYRKITFWKGKLETGGITSKTFPTGNHYRRAIRWLVIQKVYKKNG